LELFICNRQRFELTAGGFVYARTPPDLKLDLTVARL
jgi:hypothetical protein